MGMNIKNPEVERLAAQVADMAKENKTEAIRRALLERKERLMVRRVRKPRTERLLAFLEKRVWPQIPRKILGTRLSKEQRERILGYGPGGV
jgi:antitoxin VapB